MSLNTAQESLDAVRTLESSTAPAPSPGASHPPPEPKSSEDKSAEDKARLERIQDRVKAVLLPILCTALFLAFWQAFSQQEGIMLPGPGRVVVESKEFILHPFFDNGANDKGLGLQVYASLKRVAIGYGMAAIVGIILGLMLGKLKPLYQGLDPLMQVFRTIPPLAWLPISLAIFNQSEPASIWVIFITAIWPIIINTSVGVMRMPRDYENVAQVYQVTGSRYLFLVMLPAVAPYMFTGLRIAVGMAWLGIVAAEMLTGGVGVGFFIWDCWNSGRVSDIVVALAYVGLVGLALDRAVAGVALLFGSRTD